MILDFPAHELGSDVYIKIINQHRSASKFVLGTISVKR